MATTTTMTKDEIVQELEKLGNESTKRVLVKHGAREPFFGVKIEDLKKIQKKIKKDHELSLALYGTGISDAMYLAGLIADEERITVRDLDRWAKEATWGMLSEYTVPWVAAESPHGWDRALAWIDSKEPHIAASGWATLSSLVGLREDEDLDVKRLEKLLGRVESQIAKAPDRVRYTMNGFVIALGAGVKSLTARALETAKRIGEVSVDMGDTSCKVPDAVATIQKIKGMGRIGKKRKHARC